MDGEIWVSLGSKETRGNGVVPLLDCEMKGRLEVLTVGVKVEGGDEVGFGGSPRPSHEVLVGDE